MKLANAEIKIPWSYTSISPCVFMAGCLIKQNDKFVFTLHSSSLHGDGGDHLRTRRRRKPILRQATSLSAVHASGPYKADVRVAQTLARTRVGMHRTVESCGPKVRPLRAATCLFAR